MPQLALHVLGLQGVASHFSINAEPTLAASDAVRSGEDPMDGNRTGISTGFVWPVVSTLSRCVRQRQDENPPFLMEVFSGLSEMVRNQALSRSF